ncbi:hypothetical protein K8942_06075 [Candidatus Peribacteria bacterium]|nr:MAG: hypothetical protein K8942_06075 [Candidatus Peribacteria bacterium]
MRQLLLLPSALLLLLTSLSASAQTADDDAEATSGSEWTTSPQCETILSLEPISSYTKDVLDRADAGLTAAHTLATDADFQRYKWVRNVGSAFAGLIDTHLRLVVQADDLAHHSACLHFDLVSIECKMDQVRNELHTQLERGSVVAIIPLQKLLIFLNERYEHLAAGALNPQYHDPTWELKTAFDEPSTSYEGQDMCPYDSDYAAPQLNGYGCDLDVLSARTAFDPLKKEHDALQVISNQLEEYREDAAQFLSVQESINTLFRIPTTLPEPPEERTHLRASGCGWTGGLCSDDSTRKCEESADCGDGNSCIFPTKVCEGNTAMVCVEDISCLNSDGANVGPCIEKTKETPATTELRGPFSLPKKHLELLMDFMTKRIAEGNNREFPDDLKQVGEFAEDQVDEKERRANDAYITSLVRDSTRLLYALWSRIQGAGEAITFPSASDAQLEVAASLSPLRRSVGDLARLTMKTGDKNLRSFVIKYAYFLRRSCMFRACNDSLDEVLKIVFTDECFPYTNGDFLNDTAANPRSTQCAEGAEITVP